MQNPCNLLRKLYINIHCHFWKANALFLEIYFEPLMCLFHLKILKQNIIKEKESFIKFHLSDVNPIHIFIGL